MDNPEAPWSDEPHPFVRWIVIATTVIGLAIVAAMIALWPPGDIETDSRFFPTDVVPATVTRVRTGPCRNAEDLTCTKVTYEIERGEFAGSPITQDFFGDVTDPQLAVGDGVVLNYTEGTEIAFAFNFADRQRRPTLWILAGLFSVAVIALGRWKGFTALAALAVSFTILLAFILPALLGGRSPLAVALVGAGAVAYVTLYLGHGVTIDTTVALLGSMMSLLLVGVLGGWAVDAAALSGFATEESVILPLLGGALDFRGLILAGLVLGTMGALDDVTITQTEAIRELHLANPDLTPAQLMAAGLRIGRAHIGSTVNTLALAYTGAALPLLLLFLVANQSLGTIANSEIIATEIIRTLAGSVGLVASVPLTTWLAAHIVGGAPQTGDGSH